MSARKVGGSFEMTVIKLGNYDDTNANDRWYGPRYADDMNLIMQQR